MRGEKATRSCDTCEQPTTKLLSQARGKGWFCSTSCSATKQWRDGLVAPSLDTTNPLQGQSDTRPCANCGTPVTRYLSQRRLAQFWTCSRQCLGVVNMARQAAEGRMFLPTKPRRGETNPCEVCGTPVYRNKSQAVKGEGRYCSRACHDVAQTKAPVLKACPVCDKELRLKPSQGGIQYCSRWCMGTAKIAQPLDRMHNGKSARLDPKGYVLIWEPEHPNKSMKGWQFEHRVVVEKLLGRYLARDEHVDHINQQKSDNRPGNLQVLSPSAHSVKTWQDRVGDLETYRRLYGPLPGKE